VRCFKKEFLSIMIFAGIPTERISVNEYDPITGRNIQKKSYGEWL